MTDRVLWLLGSVLALLAVVTVVLVAPGLTGEGFDPLPAAREVVRGDAAAALAAPAGGPDPPAAAVSAAPTTGPAPSPTNRLWLLPTEPGTATPPPVPDAVTPVVPPIARAPGAFGGSSSGQPSLLGPDVAPSPPGLGEPLVVPYRVEVRTTDAATAGAAAQIDAILADPRGWSQAGFVLQRNDAAPYVIVLAEAPDVDALCAPYRTRSTYSCQNRGVVALNADRWRSATPQWTGDLATYRQYLVNHEVGHLLGQRHARCPGAGQPAPIMVQQSTELDGCVATGWPQPSDLAVAARHDLPLAPGPGE